MDHSLRTISYIADIGDIIVIMARRGPVSPVEGAQRKHQSKICCHVFESDEVSLCVLYAPCHSAKGREKLWVLRPFQSLRSYQDRTLVNETCCHEEDLNLGQWQLYPFHTIGCVPHG